MNILVQNLSEIFYFCSLRYADSVNTDIESYKKIIKEKTFEGNIVVLLDIFIRK